MQDHGHSKAEITKRISGESQTSHLRDMIYGGIDGAVTTFAIVAPHPLAVGEDTHRP